MPEFPSVSGGRAVTVGAVGGTSSVSTTVAGSASANTKGSFVELIASTAFDASWVIVQINSMNSFSRFLIDIAIGSATEQVIIPNLYVAGRAGDGGGPFLFPLFVPRGSRLSARLQDAGGSGAADIAVTLIAANTILGSQGVGSVVAYGVKEFTNGTNIDPGGTANTDSAWVELTAATARDHHWFALATKCGDNSIAADTKWRVSLGIGASTEAVLVPDLHFSADASTEYPVNAVVCFPLFVPKGSRLSAKARSSVTGDGDRDVDVVLYGC